jgi:hypothetical protein
MPRVKFDYDSTILAEVLGSEKATEYLKLAEASYYQATILRVYGLILIVVSAGLLVIIGGAFIQVDGTARMSFLELYRVQAIFFSSVPFMILGIYVSYRAQRIRKEARKQVDTFDSSLTYFARKTNYG